MAALAFYISYLRCLLLGASIHKFEIENHEMGGLIPSKIQFNSNSLPRTRSSLLFTLVYPVLFSYLGKMRCDYTVPQQYIRLLLELKTLSSNIRNQILHELADNSDRSVGSITETAYEG